MHLILGGVRSGKSAFAETLATSSQRPVTYVATATQGDDEAMQARIARHRERRPDHWSLVEEPVELARVLGQSASPDGLVLVDCLTLWLTNLLLSEDETLIARECDALISLAPRLPGQLLLVSNEVGMGIVPMGELSRRYCDIAGELHQSLAARADRVTLVVAGLPHSLKGQSYAVV